MQPTTFKTYVYNNVEVRKTDRQAERKLPSGKSEVLVEITPIDSTVGVWKKWAKPVELFEVGVTEGTTPT